MYGIHVNNWASIMASATLDDLGCHGRAPRRPHRKALEPSGPHSTWPEVADTVIKANNFTGVILLKNRAFPGCVSVSIGKSKRI
jgi:hypothetical protein